MTEDETLHVVSGPRELGDPIRDITPSSVQEAITYRLNSGERLIPIRASEVDRPILDAARNFLFPDFGEEDSRKNPYESGIHPT